MPNQLAKLEAQRAANHARVDERSVKRLRLALAQREAAQRPKPESTCDIQAAMDESEAALERAECESIAAMLAEAADKTRTRWAE